MEDTKRKELRAKVIDLLMKTYSELGQVPEPDTVDMNVDLLVKDIQQRYYKMSWEVVTLAFENGVRETEDFSINAKTWNRWLITMRAKLWAGEADMKLGSNHKVPKQIQSIINNQKLIE